MKRFLLFFAMIISVGLISSCEEKGPHKDDIVRFTATMNSQQTIPRATSSAQGTGVFEYNKTTMELSYNLTYQNLTPKSASINYASPAWEAGDIIFELPNPTATQTAGKVTLNVEQQTWLIEGSLYVNLPTEENIYGEIRGQILPVKE